jgi:hypothetical protein
MAAVHRGGDRCRRGQQEELDAADVVLVAVGGDERDDAVGVLAQVGEVGQDQVDAVHVGFGEHEAAVDEHDRAVGSSGALLDRHAVAADLAEATEEDDAATLGTL